MLRCKCKISTHLAIILCHTIRYAVFEQLYMHLPFSPVLSALKCLKMFCWNRNELMLNNRLHVLFCQAVCIHISTLVGGWSSFSVVSSENDESLIKSRPQCFDLPDLPQAWNENSIHYFSPIKNTWRFSSSVCKEPLLQRILLGREVRTIIDRYLFAV